ncbi:OmpA family protein [Eisenibacter elegans]|uniref:OmpA family protein n=1 Tax=Eisenibacter elegans TaxID=997 RepID=UPI0003F68C4A|nr:OmpA family protein [Eisenibacter elegans]
MHAQEYSTNNKAAIKAYESGNALVKARQFDQAEAAYRKAIEKDARFAEAYYKIGVIHQLFERPSMYPAFAEAIRLLPNDKRFAPAYPLMLHKEMSEGKYAEAETLAQQFLRFGSKDEAANRLMRKTIADVAYARKGMLQPLNYQSRPLPAPINQFFVQYFPVLTADGKQLIFTARAQERSDENMYRSYWNGSQWSAPESLSGNINTPNNEGSCSISGDGKVLVFTACEDPNKENYGKCDLYVSLKEGDTWSKPVNMGPGVNTAAWESHPTLSADGKTLFFVSNRGGGKGGNDIWMSRMDENGDWGKAVNVSALNTPEDEVAPFLHANGRVLYFASKGYPGYGGFDLYAADWENEQWGEVRNLGYPINTHEDQIGLFITADGQKGYYSVERFEGRRIVSSVLHELDVPEEVRPSIKTNYVRGMVYNAKTKEKLAARIELIDINNNQRQALVSSDAQTGEYLIVLNAGAEYALQVRKEGFTFKSLPFNYVLEDNPQPLEMDIPLDPIEAGTVFVLENIFFETGKYALQDKSKAALDELVKFMQQNPALRGEISGHTDNVGTAEANQALSINRAKAVYEYLINAGIAAERLRFQGYGATKPAADNSTEAGRAKNRRIEFTIL